MTTQRTFEDTLRAYHPGQGKGQHKAQKLLSRKAQIYSRPHAEQRRQPKPFPRPVMHADLVRETPPPIQWDVEPLIGHGDRVVVYGRSGAKKSWILHHLALHLAAGQTWFGKFAINEPRTVLYIDEEMGKLRFWRRHSRLVEGLGYGDINLPLGALFRHGFLVDATGPEQLLADFDTWDWKPDVIIVETFRKVLVGDENHAPDVSAFWRHLNPIIEASITFIVSHHTPKGLLKPGPETIYHASGSGEIVGGGDVAFGVYSVPGSDEIHVQNGKARDGRDAMSYIIRADFGETTDSPVRFCLDDSKEAELKAQQLNINKVQQAVRLICAYLQEQSDQMAKRANIVAYLASQSISESTMERALGEMKAEGMIDNPKQGYWRLVPEIKDDISPAA